jgi:hypothetical protein
MFRVDRVIKPWKESAALNDHINLYGQWSDTTFLTKSGDVGMVLCVGGVDYESLDSGAQEYAVKRLESALKSFGLGFHVYQYLFKSNRPEIPFASYDDPIVQTEVNHPPGVLRLKAGQPLSYRDLLLHSSPDCTGEERHRAGTFPSDSKSGTGIQGTESSVLKQWNDDPFALGNRKRMCTAGPAGGGIRAPGRRSNSY